MNNFAPFSSIPNEGFLYIYISVIRTALPQLKHIKSSNGEWGQAFEMEWKKRANKSYILIVTKAAPQLEFELNHWRHALVASVLLSVEG